MPSRELGLIDQMFHSVRDGIATLQDIFLSVANGMFVPMMIISLGAIFYHILKPAHAFTGVLSGSKTMVIMVLAVAALFPLVIKVTAPLITWLADITFGSDQKKSVVMELISTSTEVWQAGFSKISVWLIKLFYAVVVTILAIGSTIIIAGMFIMSSVILMVRITLAPLVVVLSATGFIGMTIKYTLAVFRDFVQIFIVIVCLKFSKSVATVFKELPPIHPDDAPMQFAIILCFCIIFLGQGSIILTCARVARSLFVGVDAEMGSAGTGMVGLAAKVATKYAATKPFQIAGRLLGAAGSMITR